MTALECFDELTCVLPGDATATIERSPTGRTVRVLIDQDDARRRGTPLSAIVSAALHWRYGGDWLRSYDCDHWRRIA